MTFSRFAALFLAACFAVTSAFAEELRQFQQTAAGIDFYVEERGDGPPVVLIPSGQGDCGAYKLLAENLAADFRVVTFDMPGFSRSSPPEWEALTSALMADQVAALVTSLGIEQAIFYGSSSGGSTVFSLVADHPALVRSAIAHEPALMASMAPAPYTPAFTEMFVKRYEDAAIKHGSYYEASKAAQTADSLLAGASTPWESLGADYNERKHQNHETWVKRYLKGGEYPCCNRVFTRKELARTPLVITLGMSSLGYLAGGLSDFAARAGVETVWLPGAHFPYISYPAIVAEVIRSQVR